MIKLFVIRDAKADACVGGILQFAARGAAVREFETLVNTEKAPSGQASVYFDHPEDFTLYEIGSFDEQSGSLVASDVVNLGSGANYVKVRTGGIS